MLLCISGHVQQNGSGKSEQYLAIPRTTRRHILTHSFQQSNELLGIARIYLGDYGKRAHHFIPYWATALIGRGKVIKASKMRAAPCNCSIPMLVA